MTSLANLKRARSNLKRSMDKLRDCNVTEMSAAEINVRLEQIEKLYTEFKTTQDSIEEQLLNTTGSEDLLKAEEAVRDNQEETYVMIKTKFITKRDEIMAGQAAEAAEAANESVTKMIGTLSQEQARLGGMIERLTTTDTRPSNSSNTVKLPTINIPKFSGRYEDWISFHDTFQNLVDENPALSPVQQMHYLKDALIGEAASTIRHMAISDSNYKAAWAHLKARYHKSKYITDAHLKRMIDFPPINKPTAQDIRQLLNTFEEATRALQALGYNTSQWDCWLVYVASHKLDSTSRQLWARHSASDERPTFSSFISCLEERLHELQSYSMTLERQRTSRSPTSRTVATANSQSSSASQSYCFQCGGLHPLFRCEEFIKMNETQRKTTALQANVCYNCLVIGHTASQCKSIRCKVCQGLHHTLLHASRGALTNTHQAATNTSNGGRGADTSYILPTATAHYHLPHGVTYPCRMLLDSGSEVSLITHNLTKTLQLSWTALRVPISGIAENSKLTTLGTTTLTLTSKSGTERITISALVVHKILNNIPTKRISRTHLGIGTKLQLADPEFDKPAPVDILLGAEPTLRIFRDQQAITTNRYTARNTLFGWVITGIIDSNTRIAASTYIGEIIIDPDINNSNIEKLLRRFWEIDTIDNGTVMTPEEAECETHFTTTAKRTHTGRYIVELPFKQQHQPLGDSRERAVQRLNGLEKRFKNNRHLRLEYTKFMAEYLELGHMSPLTSQDMKLGPEQTYYIPHHAVIKPTSSKTKLRVVFDASAKTTSGVSLNDKLMVGPTIQSDIFALLSGFRTYIIAMIADITKMYRQILVDNSSANYQRIVWRFSTDEPIIDYKLNTVTYGTASAPFQAVRTLHEIANDGRLGSEQAAHAIQNNFYVDDYLGGADTIHGALQLKQDIKNVLISSGIELRGWVSNSPLLSDTCSSQTQAEPHAFDNNEQSSVLGLRWNPSTDTFTFNINISTPTINTKRTFLATTARIFDPLGFIAPITIIARIQLQQLWTLGIGWDDPIPDVVANKLARYIGQLTQLSDLHIRRYIGSTKSLELFGFADASEAAYAAVIYARSRTENGSFEVTLVASRTKVAPIKQITLPRLELCAADLLAKLMRKVASSLHIDFSKCHCYTDSQVTLAWISDNPRRWKTFVANRTSNIISVIPPERWHHVGTKHNPADCASRGLDPDQLLGHHLWWNGPHFLGAEIHQSTRPALTADDNVLAEAREVIINVLTVEGGFPVYKFSSWIKLQRVTATCMRFIQNLRANHTHQRKSGPLTIDEFNRAFNILIRLAQAESFEQEHHLLQRNSPLPKSSRIASLDPFIDKDGVMRINGRLGNSKLPFNQQHPILLHRKHHITQLIVRHEHQINLHAAHRLLQTTLLNRFWIIGAPVLIKQTIRGCITCVRHRAQTLQQKMAPLPSVRVTAARAFANCGIDYAGPIIIKSWHGRSAKQYKAYIAIFVCLATKAIHIEPVTELTTECFIAALRRFISRRGRPDNIYSDNGTNFSGANKEISRLYDALKSSEMHHGISDFSTSRGIAWHFIPPAAPHFGGIWEAGVKAVKFHLVRVIGNASLTFEELSTLLCQVEYCLNSRPLCPLTGDPSDISSLTPNHFLIGLSPGLLPDAEQTSRHCNYLRRWKYIQRIHNDLWNRWNDEYLRQLQHRNKWTSLAEDVILGSLVIVKTDNSPPATWQLARIICLHPGKDGHVRVVTIRTQHGEFKRPITKLVLLPVNHL